MQRPAAPGAKARVLTAAFDRSVADFAIAADGRLYFTAEDQGFVRR